MSVPAAAHDDRWTTADVIAGFLAAAAIFVAILAAMDIRLTINGVALAFRPVRVGVATEVAALLAAAMGSGRSRLPAYAVGICTACWFIGMVVAVVTHRPLF